MHTPRRTQSQSFEQEWRRHLIEMSTETWGGHFARTARRLGVIIAAASLTLIVLSAGHAMLPLSDVVEWSIAIVVALSAVMFINPWLEMTLFKRGRWVLDTQRGIVFHEPFEGRGRRLDIRDASEARIGPRSIWLRDHRGWLRIGSPVSVGSQWRAMRTALLSHVQLRSGKRLDMHRSVLGGLTRAMGPWVVHLLYWVVLGELAVLTATLTRRMNMLWPGLVLVAALSLPPLITVLSERQHIVFPPRDEHARASDQSWRPDHDDDDPSSDDLPPWRAAA